VRPVNTDPAMSPRMVRSVRAQLLTLGIVAATQVWIIDIELRSGALDEAPASGSPVREQPQSPPASSSSTAPSDQVARHVATILARPLFSPSRRPPAVGASSTATSLTRLTGVILSPAGKNAIFAGPVGAKPLVIGEGDRISRFLVERIEVGAVILTGAEGEQVLHPAYDPSPPPKRPTPSPIIQPIVIPGSTAPPSQLSSPR
jgi:hypothetical protein